MNKLSQIKHPAKYTDKFLPIFADKLRNVNSVYDPFAGTGKIGCLKEHGWFGEIYCCEIEPEWAMQYPGITAWFICDASKTSFIANESFEAICTSPTYGNRMADHFNAKDKSIRINYKSKLGHDLNQQNTGRMQWSQKYRDKHFEVYLECYRVLKINGLFILNVSDHIRNSKIIKVSDWHKETLESLGFKVIEDMKISTNRMGFGANAKLRVDHERIIILEKYKKVKITTTPLKF